MPTLVSGAVHLNVGADNSVNGLTKYTRRRVVLTFNLMEHEKLAAIS
jgi:hypothetical protein